MGFINNLRGKTVAIETLDINKKTENDKIIALAGNPNVGKSTVFNALTGMNQHTGNWPGKTVSNAQGYCKYKDKSYVFVDIPGTYSLMAHSAEEEVARNFICFGKTDTVVVVCDATCLERNLNLVLQVSEISKRTIVCVNLMDEARRKNISIDLKLLSKKLGLPVVGVTARKKKTLSSLLEAISATLENEPTPSYEVKYPAEIESAIDSLVPLINTHTNDKKISRFIALELLNPSEFFTKEIDKHFSLSCDENICEALENIKNDLQKNNIDDNKIKDKIVFSLVSAAERICKNVVTYGNEEYSSFDKKLDKVLTGKRSAYLIMLVLLGFIFWLTIFGANYPSVLLSKFFSIIEIELEALFISLNVSSNITSALISGVYKVLTWVVSVMLPPMAIFFPLFTLLEDSGYLPRIAYNLDKPFQMCSACGKQALTMCMGFGCNAAGVIGCRIIDSERERLLAILTNSFVPCNGRFPTLILMISMLFIGVSSGIFSSLISAFFLTLLILFSFIATFIVTKILSKTLLKGAASSFTLEMPPYRKPQLLKVLVRSIFDRTLFVLGRAVAVAAPAGLIIWIFANINISGITILEHCSSFLEPFANLLGLDGIILIAFILGFPANEIVIPIIIMAYLSQGAISQLSNVSEIFALFTANGWTYITFINVMLFSLFHWPCSTTVITIKKETKSTKWALFSIILPTLCGILICFITNLIYNILV